ncbi:MAG TPA: hypothetical protein VF469_41675 [Kofleriaceae bacterium]
MSDVNSNRASSISLWMDDRSLRQPRVRLLAHGVLHDRRDVVAADRLCEPEHELRQILSELARRGVALLRIPGERLVDDALEVRRNAPVDLRDRRDLRGLDLVDDLNVGIAGEQALRREQLPQDDPDGKDVGAAIDLPPQRDLGREIRCSRRETPPPCPRIRASR